MHIYLTPLIINKNRIYIHIYIERQRERYSFNYNQTTKQTLNYWIKIQTYTYTDTYNFKLEVQVQLKTAAHAGGGRNCATTQRYAQLTNASHEFFQASSFDATARQFVQLICVASLAKSSSRHENLPSFARIGLAPYVLAPLGWS